MECSKCQFQNPDGIKFCGECGTKLGRKCPRCSSMNPPQFKFCGECGQDLILKSEPIPTELSFDEKLDKIQRYLPKGLTEKILSQRDRIEGERKQVTVMFCDMEGFTPLTEKLGIEETYAIMDQVYEILIHKVHDFGGTVNELTGDGIMALFGAPLALEDAPQRAIRSAYVIYREMRHFSDKISSERGAKLPLKMRIGINTGTVVVGTLGNDLRVDFKAVGNTVNLASRMEGLAEPGSTYVSDTTFKLTKELFRFEALGDHVIKGRTDKIRAYRVIAPNSLRTRFDVSAERGLTPFQGRERELELLMDGFERAVAGHGQAFSIMAEAGLGKSRLLYEFRKAVADRDVFFMEGKCLSYSRNVPNYPLIDILKSNFGIVENDTEAKIIEKVEKGLKLLKIDEKEMPYILNLFSIENSGVNPTMRPETVKDFTIKALKQIVLNLSQRKPLIIAIEDLHWVDKNSEDIFKIWLNNISGVPIFLIFTYRPEYIHQWGGKSYHNQINLNKLSNRESLFISSHLLGSSKIFKNLEELILEKTEGVPFFIEEFIRSLKDANIIQKKNNQYSLAKDVQKMQIPSTVQDVIMARVDALPEDVKDLLQVGSAIEREFSHALIKRVSKLPKSELLSKLSILKDAELLYERGIYPNSTYIFKHALTREVVFDSILSNRKEKLSDEIGSVMEIIYKDNFVEYSEILANYFVGGKNYAKAEKYFKISSKKAQKTASFTNAIDYAKKRVNCLEKLPLNNSMEKRIIDARTVLGLYCIQLFSPIEAKTAIDPIIDLTIKRDYKKRIAQIYIIMAYYQHWVEDDYYKAINYCEKAKKIGEKLNDVFILAIACNGLGMFFSDTGDFKKAFQYGKSALEYAEASGLPWAISQAKSLLVIWVYNPLGRIDLSVRDSKNAIRIANENDDTYAKAQAYYAIGCSYCHYGNLIKAERYLHKAIECARKINFITMAAISNFWLGAMYFYTGEYKKGREALEKSISVLQEKGIYPSLIYASRLLIAGIKLMDNKRDINLHDLFRLHGNIKSKSSIGPMINPIGTILLRLDAQYHAEAENWIKKSLKTDEKYDMKWSLAHDHVLYYKWFKNQGEITNAKVKLEQALNLFTECCADGWVEKYKLELASLA